MLFKKSQKFMFASLAPLVLLAGCSSASSQTVETISSRTGGTTQMKTVSENSTYFTDQDQVATYDEASAATIQLAGAKATVSGEGVSVDGSTVTISKAGTYVISGESNGIQIVVAVGEGDDVQLVLDNVSLSSSSAPISVTSAKHVTVTLAEGSQNQLADSSSNNDEDADAALFSKVDLTINGSGQLTIEGNSNNGIKANDTLHITGGTFDITAAGDAFNVNDELNIQGTTMTITATEDAVKVDNDEDLSVGNMYLANNTMTISAGDDAIHASGNLVIDSGSYTVSQSTEAIEGKSITINDGTIDVYATDDAINAANASASTSDIFVTINGGDIKVAVGQGDTDAIDSNGNLTVNGGTLDITAQSAFDFDGQVSYNGGTIVVNGEEQSDIVATGPGHGGGFGGR